MKDLIYGKKKNKKVSAYNQTIAILYLLIKNINIKLDDENDGIDPSEAIITAERQLRPPRLRLLEEEHAAPRAAPVQR